jgi:hypothetical protein
VDDTLAIAAGNILEQSKGAVQTVVMGHTHLAREVSPAANPALFPDDWRERLELAQQRGAQDVALYINTGTWADRVRMNFDRLSDDEYLVSFLRDLIDDVRPNLVAHFADIVVAASGEVLLARLGEDART